MCQNSLRSFFYQVRADRRQFGARQSVALVQSAMLMRADRGMHKLELRARGEGHGSSKTWAGPIGIADDMPGGMGPDLPGTR